MAFWKQLRPALWILGVPVALVGLLIVAQVLDSSFIHTRTPERFLIPEGYKGWVRIEFSAANSPAVPIEDGYLTFRFNPDGTLKTSSKFTQAWRNKGYSWAHDQYLTSARISLSP
jgi:hypothetical protein